MTPKTRTTIYLPAYVMHAARAYNINVSQAATAGVQRAVRKAELMRAEEERIEQELNKMELEE